MVSIYRLVLRVTISNSSFGQHLPIENFVVFQYYKYIRSLCRSKGKVAMVVSGNG